MRHFRKIANRAIVACAGKIFCESFGKSFWEIVLGKYLIESIIAGVEIFTNGILWMGWKTIAHERGLGSVGNPGFGNLDIAKGCNRMVERSRGHMGHIEGMFRNLFLVHFLRRTSRKIGSKCPMCPQGKNDFGKILTVERRACPKYRQGHPSGLYDMLHSGGDGGRVRGSYRNLSRIG